MINKKDYELNLSTISLLYRDILNKKISINDLENLKESIFVPFANMILSEYKDDNFILIPSKIMEEFIKLCINYYTYSENGDILIPDSLYIPIENKYIAMGNERIIYADIITDYTQWPFIEHTAPGMVGSIDKIYTEEELQKYLNGLSDIELLFIAPKYDGISACLEKSNGKIEYAVTRADGNKGQNILPVIIGAKNINIFNKLPNGYYKVELCVSQDDFNELTTFKGYSNRRSATAGLVNTPKNTQYSKYLTIIPLAYYDGKKGLTYMAPETKVISYTKKVHTVMEEIDNMFSVIRKSDFPFRTDGAVIFPQSSNLVINHNDIMEDAIAFKVNTAEARTPIKYGYMSVGRMGNAIPMLKVEPVEVNETIVEDVSLGSFDKYVSMDLHEGETVIVYSAGDVIPQIRIPENREYPKNAEYLRIRKRCSYCEETLERIGNEYKCTNSNCIRIITGKITNFLIKLNAENISDKTVEDLFNAKLLSSIKDLFSLDIKDISKLQGYGESSANNIVEEIKKLSKKEISVSALFGALGIQDIGEKKCRKMFQEITLEDSLEKPKKKIIDKVLRADNIGMITAEIFTDFIFENRNLIRFLIDNMNIKMDKKYKGNVVFTGFRDDSLTKKFDTLGYEVSGNVTSNTVAVITATNSEKSTKCIEAKRKGKSIVNLADVERLLKDLKHNTDESFDHYDD